MAHEIEVLSNGRAAFFSARQPAWHQLGTVTPYGLSAREVMEVAHLGGWNVRKIRLMGYEQAGSGIQTVPVRGQFAVVRDHPITGEMESLGDAVVGAGYRHIQNEEHAEFLDVLVREAGAEFETAGSLRRGRQVFVTMKLPEGLRVAGVDDFDLYVAALNSHDGTSAFRVLITPVRVVCANTWRLGLAEAVSSVSIRHSGDLKGKVEEARQTLGLMWAYAEEFEHAVEKLCEQELTDAAFREIIRQVWPLEPDPSTRARANATRREDTLMSLFREAPTNAAIRGSAAAGLQAVGEYLDHFAPAKNTTARATRTLISADVAQRKQHAYELLSAVSPGA
ncbi:hypothetical protein GCM10012275_50500 [Longimycelium tulufanense]|uniref:DUF945 domain-containing protein n=1 Tax=Longimycelium tulufanense TaxID=907463 RepID=A0A8J3CIU8_9PSEU|nr:DUF932 domain-containing protein [Longimycelium tulufanense]GGM73662.1 hypothetical protein GCM10012275_50500 [Longimycelium tulufanense]